MDTAIATPKALFQKDVRYTIPTFQRPYVWSHDDQWDPLWKDVSNLAENYLEALERCDNNSVKAEQETKAHFLGAVVLQQVPTPAKEIEQREVIDGQQRVTTLQLLLDAIQAEIREDLSLRNTATRLSKLVSNDEDLVGDERHHRFKLWPTRGDREAFTHAMDNRPAVNDFEQSRIVQAHDFFKEQVREWLDKDETQKRNRADALETAVTALLQMVVIDLDYKDDPNVIFETLNARGTPLQQSDLIKNFVISRPGMNNAGEAVWGNLDAPWWHEEVRQGRLHRPRLDMLINYWLAMNTGDDVAPLQVFNVFRNRSSKVPIDTLMSLMSDIQRDLNNYRSFETGERTPKEDVFRYRLGVMQAGVITPVLLLLLSSEHEARIGAFRALESFLIRRMLSRKTTKDYNRLILDLARRLRESNLEKPDKVVAGFLRNQEADSRKWPSDEDLVEDLQTSPLYSLLTRGRLRLVLEGIESRLRSAKAEQTDVPQNLTIEHLMPVSWEAKWPLPDGIENEESRRERNRIVHTIGNLTLVTQSLNSALSNDRWEVKREELLKHSVLNLNSELMNEGHWDEEAIRARSRRMARLIADCWPGPTATEWN